jgi:gliding motility-associated transport system ATP-binding protein
MIEIKDLTKDFGSLRAVDGISFSVGRGEVLGFLGPNGAGKSTTMKMITGFLTPTSGTAVVSGHDVGRDPIGAKSSIGYLPEGAPLYPDMTPAGFLDFIAEIRGLSGSVREARIREVVGLVHIEGVMHQRIDTLSKGFKRRVGIAQAILHDPEVLILDEPTDGLDPNQKHEVRTLIRKMAADKVIVLSTHILEEVEAVCTRAIIIAQGRLCFDGTPIELAARSRRHNAVALTVRSGAVQETVSVLQDLAGVAAVEPEPAQDGLATFHVIPRNGRPLLDDVARAAHDQGWEVEQIFVETGRLDDVFREITTAGAGERS